MKDCPFCGSSDVIISHMQLGLNNVFFGHCKDCGANGPTSTYANYEAEQYWNKRYETKENTIKIETVSETCARTGMQNCTQCDNFNCGDNTNPDKNFSSINMIK